MKKKRKNNPISGDVWVPSCVPSPGCNVSWLLLLPLAKWGSGRFSFWRNWTSEGIVEDTSLSGEHGSWLRCIAEIAEKCRIKFKSIHWSVVFSAHFILHGSSSWTPTHILIRQQGKDYFLNLLRKKNIVKLIFWRSINKSRIWGLITLELRQQKKGLF